jgi:hypothetical protein
VQKQNVVVILFNRLGRIASTRNQMGSIQLKLRIFWIGVFED